MTKKILNINQNREQCELCGTWHNIENISAHDEDGNGVCINCYNEIIESKKSKREKINNIDNYLKEL